MTVRMSAAKINAGIKYGNTSMQMDRAGAGAAAHYLGAPTNGELIDQPRLTGVRDRTTSADRRL